MLSKGLRISFGVGIVLILLALGLHALLRYYNAPADAEYDLLNVFAATFASTILAFFIGALLFDYQIERTEARRDEQFKMLLAAELDEIMEGLDRANALRIHSPDGSTVEMVIAHIPPIAVEEAVRAGFFEPSRARTALRLARNMRTYSARISLLSTMLSGTARGPDSGPLVLHEIEEVEQIRQMIVADARLLAGIK